MIRTYKSCQVVDDMETVNEYSRWQHATIEFSKPLLLSTFKYEEDDGVVQIGTHIHTSLDEIEFDFNQTDLPVQKLQILVPDGLGWVLLDVVTVRRCNFFDVESNDDNTQ